MRITVFSASELKRLDWIDIAIHVGIAIAGVSLLHLLGLPLWLVIAFNTIVWPAREWWQKVDPDEDHLTFEEATFAIFTRPQPFMEWTLPVIAGFALYGVLA